MDPRSRPCTDYAATRKSQQDYKNHNFSAYSYNSITLEFGQRFHINVYRHSLVTASMEELIKTPTLHPTDRTGTVSPQPFIKHGICERMQQHKDRVIGRDVGLSSCTIEEQVSEVMEASDCWVVLTRRLAVPCGMRSSPLIHEDKNPSSVTSW